MLVAAPLFEDPNTFSRFLAADEIANDRGWYHWSLQPAAISHNPPTSPLRLILETVFFKLRLHKLGFAQIDCNLNCMPTCKLYRVP